MQRKVGIETIELRDLVSIEPQPAASRTSIELDRAMHGSQQLNGTMRAFHLLVGQYTELLQRLTEKDGTAVNTI